MRKFLHIRILYILAVGCWIAYALFGFGRHPVHNQYLPTQLKDNVYLLKEGDLSDRIWDEEALKVWEREANDGKEWEGRHKDHESDRQN